ncbi:sarcosine oxidase subunit gamma [Acinetobacter sp. MD2(2019)]|uniref:sarcosine oxidase subunit gamma n=1 Tax=Acinetobacter sp. MD2(2019) TaxID=2605273 RepID=UPI002D1E95A5|nr:sarcosine oxidase subunit gamma family protein [Acinetobacter sp. MD2(2019)]MEB3753326.1 sarcosine oxidase [Acinetobacter sp. MD2(2019)]
MQALYQAERSPIEIGGSQVAYQTFASGKRFLQGGSAANDTTAACRMVDLTNLSRVGFRGQDAAAYLSAHGFELPQQPNQAVQQDDGCWVMRLSLTEYCVLGSLKDFGERVSQLEQAWQMDERANYLLTRQDSHAWILVSSAHIAEIMAKLCAVDLRPEVFPVGQIAQTSVARINAMVTNVSDQQATKFNILCDRAAALYLWEVLQDAIQEFDGKIVGIDGLL